MIAKPSTLQVLTLTFPLFLLGCSYESSDALNAGGAYYGGSSGGASYYQPPGEGREQYVDNGENPFVDTATDPTSTFSVDADGASYANIRRMICAGGPVYQDAVRAEEFVNYFLYDEPEPAADETLGVTVQTSVCPWKPEHHLARIAIQGKRLAEADLPRSNIVMLVDVSGSMSSDDKLPVVKYAMKLLVDQFRPDDVFSLVTYSGEEDVKVDGVNGDNKEQLHQQIDGLTAGGSTAGAAGIQTAYEIARKHFVTGGNNRIILATDGDFNVGISDTDRLLEFIENERKSGVMLTAWGVGTGNLNEAMLEQVANNGNGNYEYLDSEAEVRKVIVTNFGKMHTIAKDVKVQVTFDPTVVKRYRLIGYENRALADSDFANDATDAGEIGAGQTVTALYEIERETDLNLTADEDGLISNTTWIANGATVTLRYKGIPREEIREFSVPLRIHDLAFNDAQEDFRFAASTAAFALLLQNSNHVGDTTYDDIITWADAARNYDPEGLRAEFVELVAAVKQ